MQGIGVERDIDETTVVVDGNFRLQYTIHDLLERTNGVIQFDTVEYLPEKEPIFELTKKNILFSRTDTDGFQLKAISSNRRWFMMLTVGINIFLRLSDIDNTAVTCMLRWVCR